jgi:hypothetical protein
MGEILHVAAHGRCRGAVAQKEYAGMKKADQEKLRELMARKVLWELLVAAETQTDPVIWRAEGGPEAKDFLDALDSGRPHPLLLQWEQRKSTEAANRPAPGLLDQIARRNVVLMCVALHRAGLTKIAACKLAAKTVKDVFPGSPTDNAIRHWWAAYPPLTPADEALIASAISRHGRDHDQIAGWFAGLVRFAFDPAAARTATLVTR